MQLARVTGTVVATRIHDGLRGAKLLVIEPLDHAGRAVEPPLVAVDTVRAGVGDLVSFVTSREAAQALDDDFVPVDAAIIGVVDAVDAADASGAGGAGADAAARPTGRERPARGRRAP